MPRELRSASGPIYATSNDGGLAPLSRLGGSFPGLPRCAAPSFGKLSRNHTAGAIPRHAPVALYISRHRNLLSCPNHRLLFQPSVTVLRNAIFSAVLSNHADMARSRDVGDFQLHAPVCNAASAVTGTQLWEFGKLIGDRPRKTEERRRAVLKPRSVLGRYAQARHYERYLARSALNRCIAGIIPRRHSRENAAVPAAPAAEG